MAAEALQAINRILQYNQQRDQSKVQEALGFMEMAQQKQLKEIELQLKTTEMGATERHRKSLIDIEKDRLGVTTLKYIKEAEVEKKREERLGTQETRLGAKAEREKEVFDRTKFEDSLKYLKQEQLDTSAELANTFVTKFGFGEAAVMAQQEGAEQKEISSNVVSVLSKIAPNLSKKDRQFLATQISGGLFSAGQLGSNVPLMDLLDGYNDALVKKASGETLTLGESKLYNALSKFTNVSQLVQLADIANKHKIVDTAIDREIEEYRLEGDMVLPTNILEYKLPEKKSDEGDTETEAEIELKKRRIEGALLNIGDINELKEKTAGDLDDSQTTRQQLMTAMEQRSLIESAIRQAESVPPDTRTLEENELILSKEDFLEQADSAIDSLEHSLGLIEDELNNDEYVSEAIFHGDYFNLWRSFK
jgi:hypothetical protein